jgi:hypothetical protein
MNERMLELAKQAGLKKDHGSDREYVGDFDWRLFGDLIVGECLDQIDTIRDGCEADHENQQALGADWAGLAVARHFGFE